MNLLSKIRSSTGNSLQGITLLLTAFFIFSVQDVIIKLMSGDFALLQIVLIRTLFTIPIVFGILHFNGGIRIPKTSNLKLQFWRGFMMFSAYLFYFLALAALPFSLTLAVFFSGPLFIAALSVPMLGEAVGWRRWSAIIMGFFGVLIIIQPGGESFNPATVFAVLAALAYATSIILTRKLDEPGLSTTFYTTAVYLIASLIFSPIFAAVNFNSVHPSIQFLTKKWPQPAVQDVLIIIGLAFCWGVGMVMLSGAYGGTAVAILAPFEYFSILYGILFGFIFWQEIPSVTTIVGLIFIVGGGLFIIYRENQLN
ncbi:MAG: DMT family transporter [Chloroflexota bacterium]